MTKKLKLFNKKFKVKKKKKLSKFLLRFRKLHTRSNFCFNIYFKEIQTFFKIKKRFKKIFIRLTQNNVFCTLTNTNSKILLTSSSGKYKVKTSKKKIKFTLNIILKSFIKEIKNKIFKNTLLISIISPKKFRKKIIKQLLKSLIVKRQNVFIEALEKKNFNGCRPKKQKRKKRKGLRIFQ